MYLQYVEIYFFASVDLCFLDIDSDMLISWYILYWDVVFKSITQLIYVEKSTFKSLSQDKISRYVKSK